MTIRDISITRALAIPGWTSQEELLWSAETASRSNYAVEIGTYKGRSARAIAENMPDEGFLLCIDPFCDSEGTTAKNEDEWDKIAKECWSNLSDLPATRLSIWYTYSHSASEQWESLNLDPDKELDFVFIDGDHSYEGVKQDILDWFPKLRKGGVLAGHDYNVWPGVTNAVDELFRSKLQDQIESRIGFCSSVWFVTKK